MCVCTLSVTPPPPPPPGTNITWLLHYIGDGRQQDTMEIKPNPVYGISLLQTSQQSPGETEYYVNEEMGPDNYVYDYVVEAGTTTSIPTKSNPAYAIPLNSQ